MNTADFFWFNPPEQFQLDHDSLSFSTMPHTDFWQRTHYGFQADNGHCFMKKVVGDFTLSLKVQFSYQKQYDQCGIIVYIDSENWGKVSIELETPDFSRLGSVITNQGWSDWATTDIPNKADIIFYRLSRRNNDFLFEHSYDRKGFYPMRVFHLQAAKGTIAAGAYACSPKDSRFPVRFSEIEFTENVWIPE
jgi:regulation of enolase protein 1 (concanavalin A-like superfamily)